MLLGEYKGRVQMQVLDEKIPVIMNIVSRHFFEWESFDTDKICSHLKRELLHSNYDYEKDVFRDDLNDEIPVNTFAFELQRWIESNSDNLRG